LENNSLFLARFSESLLIIQISLTLKKNLQSGKKKLKKNYTVETIANSEEKKIEQRNRRNSQ